MPPGMTPRTPQDAVDVDVDSDAGRAWLLRSPQPSLEVARGERLAQRQLAALTALNLTSALGLCASLPGAIGEPAPPSGIPRVGMAGAVHAVWDGMGIRACKAGVAAVLLLMPATPKRGARILYFHLFFSVPPLACRGLGR